MSSSSVTAFPLYRRQKLVNGIASVLRAKHGEQASEFWRDTARQLLQQLTAIGMDMDAAQEEVRSLFYVVMDQIQNEPLKIQG